MGPCNLQVAFCEEQMECRRVLLMDHFGERFFKAHCNSTCDTCARNKGVVFEGDNSAPIHVFSPHERKSWALVS